MAIGRPAIIEFGPVPLPDTEILARLFRALGDATRLRILEFFEKEGELHQMELVRRLGAAQSRVSEHLACLVWCGFVLPASTEGRRIYYQVTDPQVPELIEGGRRFLESSEAEISCCRVLDREQ